MCVCMYVCVCVLCQLTPSMSRLAAELNSCQCALFAVGWKVQMLQSSGSSQPPATSLPLAVSPDRDDDVNSALPLQPTVLSSIMSASTRSFVQMRIANQSLLFKHIHDNALDCTDKKVRSDLSGEHLASGCMKYLFQKGTNTILLDSSPFRFYHHSEFQMLLFKLKSTFSIYIKTVTLILIDSQ